jgi:hypothetical protein
MTVQNGRHLLEEIVANTAILRVERLRVGLTLPSLFA